MTSIALQASGSVLGIDVGCSPTRRSSAVCRLDWTGTTYSWTIDRFRASDPERSDAIRRMAEGHSIACAAFDGPLRSDLNEIGVYRVAELMLTRQLRPFIGKPGQSSSPVGKLLNHHANECAKAVLALDVVADAHHPQRLVAQAIVEAFPSSFLGLLIEDPASLNARRGDRSDTFYSHLASCGGLDRLAGHLLPGRAAAEPFAKVSNHDDRAALICALTALALAANDYTAVGDANGWIVLPPRDLIASWAWPLLAANAQHPSHLYRS